MQNPKLREKEIIYKLTVYPILNFSRELLLFKQQRKTICIFSHLGIDGFIFINPESIGVAQFTLIS